MCTAAAIAVVWVDHATANVLAGHIRAGYPDYNKARVDSAALTYVVYLSIVGVIGLISWVSAIRAVRRSSRWVRPAATMTFILAVGLSLTNLLVRDTSGETGLPSVLGWAGLLPCLPGLVAVTFLWMDRDADASVLGARRLAGRAHHEL
jgi:hypothetical protein